MGGIQIQKPSYKRLALNNISGLLNNEDKSLEVRYHDLTEIRDAIQTMLDDLEELMGDPISDSEIGAPV